MFYKGQTIIPAMCVKKLEFWPNTNFMGAGACSEVHALSICKEARSCNEAPTCLNRDQNCASHGIAGIID